MKNLTTPQKLMFLSAASALLALAPSAKAQIIFFDDFTEDQAAASALGYTYGSTAGAIPGTTNDLTYAPAGAPTNTLAWAPISTAYTTYFGNGIIPQVGYPSGTTATNGSHTEVFLQAGNAGTANNDAVAIGTPILTGSGAAVDLVAGASYTLSLDVGWRTDQNMSTLGINLEAGGTVLDAGAGGYTEEVTLGQLTLGEFTNFSFSIPASALSGNSGALSLQLWNLANENQVNFSNIVLTENAPSTTTVPEPGSWAMLLGGIGSLFLIQRMRRKA